MPGWMDVSFQQIWQEIVEFGGLGVGILCFQYITLCLLLSIQPICCSAACGLSVLHTECRTSQRSQSKAVQSYVIFPFSVPKKEVSTCPSHISVYHWQVRWRYPCKMHVKCGTWQNLRWEPHWAFCQAASILPPSTIPWASAAGTKSPLCVYGSWLEHTELWNCIWTMGFSFLSLLFGLTLTPPCFHTERSLTPESSSSTLPPSFSLLATTQAGHYRTDTNTICYLSGFDTHSTVSVN